jgi:plastocyanin
MRTITISVLVLYFALLIIGASGCGQVVGPGKSFPQTPVESTVSIQSFAFEPAILNVSAGTTVTWTNNKAVTHTVTFDDGSLNQELAPGATVQKTFSTSGTFTYHCAIHSSMKGTVIVK